MKETEISFECCNLDVGDIEFRFDGSPFLIIERKTIPDLVASIKDGRHREQKFRLKQVSKQCRVMYIYEGDPKTSLSQKITEKTINSTISNTMIRDGFPVKETKDINHTVQFLIEIFNKLNKYKDTLSLDEQECYESSIHFKKKSYNDPKSCYIMQLCQIPGISNITAQSISDIYPDMITLCQEVYESDDPLSNMTIMTSGKPRRLGKKVAERIYEYLGKSK